MSVQKPAVGRFVWLSVCGLVACATAGATYALADRAHRTKTLPRMKADAAPSAAEFATGFVRLANHYAAVHADPVRLSGADCVEASTGHYMCSYAAGTPGGAKECHVIQARWTPRKASSFTITLSGRTTRCGSLREALSSLG
jgi:hypothetical protein